MKLNRNKIYIALGSNLRSFSIKNTKDFFNAIVFRLGLLGIKVKKRSGIWISNPIPFSSGPIFFNSVIECSLLFNNSLDPKDLLNKINKLEKKLGKKFKGKNKQRVIDIDIIDFHGDIYSDKLILPHPRMHSRKFVLLPLQELDKYWSHPLIRKNCIFLISKIKGNQMIKKSKMFS
ncbi:MAG: Bifunctional folate synthesis protein [Alphaproteobacteria bacterium MarineAlpha9_Bin4]|nr:2-amino-4-hydroxy-6-hydroxymethyldihydropteridine diphosphokinase [Pelagibacterales bacterium]PPR26128.1 MAG: Bifunctional folate synthesis protein [Alphaproteobacteria bacterium MarineAlpha9_Bin4]|tara:strand:+ start:1927 stop:2454 length:528 start_codon:yes stop_codon:yes gene_type:complete